MARFESGVVRGVDNEQRFAPGCALALPQVNMPDRSWGGIQAGRNYLSNSIVADFTSCKAQAPNSRHTHLGVPAVRPVLESPGCFTETVGNGDQQPRSSSLLAVRGRPKHSPAR